MANIPLSELDRINLDEEWQSIQNMVNGGITPSVDRIREYIQVSCLKGKPHQEAGKVISCIADILRLEEDTCSPTDPFLKDILVVLESGRSNQELKAIFTETKT